MTGVHVKEIIHLSPYKANIEQHSIFSRKYYNILCFLFRNNLLIKRLLFDILVVIKSIVLSLLILIKLSQVVYRQKVK